MTKILNDKDLLSKYKKVSKRIQDDNKILEVAKNIIEYIDKL